MSDSHKCKAIKLLSAGAIPFRACHEPMSRGSLYCSKHRKHKPRYDLLLQMLGQDWAARQRRLASTVGAVSVTENPEHVDLANRLLQRLNASAVNKRAAKVASGQEAPASYAEGVFGVPADPSDDPFGS